MKDAVGELNMTVIAVIAIAAIAALFYVFVWPMIQYQIANQTCKTLGPEYEAVAVEEGEGASGNQRNENWKCCVDGSTTDCATYSAAQNAG